MDGYREENLQERAEIEENFKFKRIGEKVEG